MSILKVPGADLHYELTGEGPPLILIPGAGGDGNIFKPAAGYLKSDFSVITYDRRGFANSALTGDQDYNVRLATDAADVARLIEHADRGPATVFGSSSGGVVALRFMLDHPPSFTKVLAHEPATMKVLPDSERWLDLTLELYDTYQTQGLPAVMSGFVAKMMSASDQATLAASAAHGDPAQRARGFDYWVEHELRQYPRADFDMEALKREVSRLVFVVGEDTKGLPPYEMAVRFAEKVGAAVKVLPGGHVGYATYPEAFARELTALLARQTPKGATLR